VKITLLEGRKPFYGCSFSNRDVSVDGKNVSAGLCSFGASIELVKKKVSEMFIFLNLTLHSFGPENFVPRAQIVKFQNDLIEEKETYKICIIYSQYAFMLGKNRLRQKPHELMHQPNISNFGRDTD
jgi:hypothetical protein